MIRIPAHPGDPDPDFDFGNPGMESDADRWPQPPKQTCAKDGCTQPVRTENGGSLSLCWTHDLELVRAQREEAARKKASGE